MSQQTDKTAGIFALVLGDLPSRQTKDEEIDTASFFTDLAHRWPIPLSIDHERGLTSICRALSISKQVMLVYDAQWSRGLRREPLEPLYWPVMIAVLSANFEGAQGSDRDEWGKELKHLNAAFTALDIADGLGGVPHLVELRSHLESRLEEVLHR